METRSPLSKHSQHLSRFFCLLTANMENPTVHTSDGLPPAQTGVKTGYHAKNGHISQIPGLSPTINTSEEKTLGRRFRVQDSDSDYIKLAKQGGHKGLLWHQESIISKPTSHKPSDLSGTVSEDIGNQSLINSEENNNPGAFQPLEPPFGTDNMSAWERDNCTTTEKEKNNDTDDIQTEKTVTPYANRKINNFRRRTLAKNSSPVDMSKLLSFGYAETDKPAQ